MNRLKELREEKGINQKRLAIELNVSQATISKYEIGLAEPDINTIISLSNYFRVSADYLIGNSDSKLFFDKSTLIDNEIELLTDYKRLTDNQKEKVAVYIKGLLQE